MTAVADRRADFGADQKFRETHLACALHSDQALCGAPRNGRPFRPGAEVTCVVCADLGKAGHCPLCESTNTKEN